MAENTTEKLDLTSNAVIAFLLKNQNTDGMSDEEKEQLKVIQSSVEESQKAEQRKKQIIALNDELMINTKPLLDILNTIDIPKSVSIIKLPFNLDAETLRFIPASNDLNVVSDFPFIDPVVFSLVTGIDEGVGTKPYRDTLTKEIDSAGKSAYDADDYCNSIRFYTTWISGAMESIKEQNTVESAAHFVNDIDPIRIKELEIEKGSVVLTYNSKATVAAANPKLENPESIWSVTACAFGKTTKYATKTKSGNGRKSKATNWIPAHSNATSISAYVIEQFGESDEKLVAVLASGKEWNANQALLRIEKTLEDESRRYYTNYLATQ